MTIPIEWFFAAPKISAVRLSPDGRRVAYFAPDENASLQIWIKDINSSDSVQLTKIFDFRPEELFWTEKGRYLLYFRDGAGDESWLLYRLDPDTGESKCLTPFPGRQVSVNCELGDDTLVVSVVSNRYAHYELYKIDIQTGEYFLLMPDDEDVLDACVAKSGEIFAKLKKSENDLEELFVLDKANNTWKSMFKWSRFNGISGVLGLSDDGKMLYVVSNHNSETSQLIEIYLPELTQNVLFYHPKYDINAVIFHPQSGKPQAVDIQGIKHKIVSIDHEIQKDIQFLEDNLKGRISILSRIQNDSRWLIVGRDDRQPIKYYLYDKNEQRLDFLFRRKAEVPKSKFEKLKSISICTEDLELNCYMMKGRDYSASSPCLIKIHGGPSLRYSWGWYGESSWLASLGYTVVHVNFRGSTGFGKKYFEKGIGEFGSGINEDIIYTMQWILDSNIAQKGNIGLIGGSFGGYAVLSVLTQFSDYFRCGIAMNARTDLTKFAKWKGICTNYPLTEKQRTEIEDFEEFYKQRSPLYQAHLIKTPVFLSAGANDMRIKYKQIEALHEKLVDLGAPVEYVEFVDDGHFTTNYENRIQLYKKIQSFLEQYLPVVALSKAKVAN